MKPELAEQRRGCWRLLVVALGCTTMSWICGCASQPIEVRQYGRMHDVLGGAAGEAYGRVALAEVMEEPHAYGVGALPGLSGEITIIDGEAWICRTSGKGVRTEGPSGGDSAAMLTVAHVNRWRDTAIEEPGLRTDALEDFILACARRQGIDADRPFPFLIEGELCDLQAHVINGRCPMKPGVQLTADTQPWRYQLEQPKPARIVGFYAPDSVGDLTHPGTRIHAHAIFDVGGQQVTAHVERLAVSSGILRIPAVE